MIDFHCFSEYLQILGQSGMHHFADADSLTDVLSDCGVDLSDLSDAQLESLFSHFGSISTVADAGHNFNPHGMSEVVDNKFSHLTEPSSFTHNNTYESNSVRFGESSEVQQYELELKGAKNLVDADRLLVNREQAEVDSIYSRLNSLSDMTNHEANRNLAHEYHNQTSALELDMSTHQRKLEQARAALSMHQAEEYKIQDKIKEILNNRKS